MLIVGIWIPKTAMDYLLPVSEPLRFFGTGGDGLVERTEHCWLVSLGESAAFVTLFWRGAGLEYILARFQKGDLSIVLADFQTAHANKLV